MVNDCVKCHGNFISCLSFLHVKIKSFSSFLSHSLPPNLTEPKKETSKNKVHKDQHLWKIWPEDSNMVKQIVGRCPVNKSVRDEVSVTYLFLYCLQSMERKICPWQHIFLPGDGNKREPDMD